MKERYAEVDEKLRPYQKELIRKLQETVDDYYGLELGESQSGLLAQREVDALFAFLSGLTTNAPAQLGEELCRIGVTTASIFDTNKTLRNFCVAHLEEELVVVGLEAIADFCALIIKEYVQTCQVLQQIVAFRAKNALRAKLLLTASEITALKMLARGMKNKEIATEMGVSERTVVNHLKQVREKLGTRSRSDTVVKAISLGIIDIQGKS